MATRPKTMREIQGEKADQGRGEVRIINISKQVVPIHMRPPKVVDFYIGAEDKRLYPGKSFMFKKSRLWIEQVDRLQKQGKIQVNYDSDKVAKQ